MRRQQLINYHALPHAKPFKDEHYEYLVETFGHPPLMKRQGGSSIMLQLAMGNSYSTTPEWVIQFTLYETSGTHVIAHMHYETQMAYGQLKRIDNTNHADINNVQATLDSFQAIRQTASAQ